MRVASAAAVVACCAFALGACGGTAARHVREESTAWPSRAERDWLERVGEWRTSLATAADGFGSSRRTAIVYADCLHAFDRVVRKPPTPRLRPAYSDFRRGCALDAAVGRAYLRKPSSVVVFGAFTTSAADSLKRSGVWFQRAVRASELGSNRVLPVRLGLQPARVSYRDPQLAAAARTIAGVPVTVRCWSRPDWNRLEGELTLLGVGFRETAVIGRARRNERLIELRGDICAAIAQARRSSGDEPANLLDRAEAFKTLAHESRHIFGEDDEADTECHAMQLVEPIARRLGISQRRAKLYAHAVWRAYPLMPSDYRTSLCVNGGALDLRPGSNVWP